MTLFDYGLPTWITAKYADSVEGDINATLLQYLKRYLGVHYQCNTEAVNHFCQTVPLFSVLWNRVGNLASSIVLPPECHGLQLSSLATYVPIEIKDSLPSISSTFWRSRVCHNIPWNPAYCKKIINEVFDARHWSICPNKDLHRYPDLDKCICIVCNQSNHPYHYLYFCDNNSSGNLGDPLGVE